ncbi:TPA: hypothetical protein ACGO91_000475, partial [Streptococcus suis]
MLGKFFKVLFIFLAILGLNACKQNSSVSSKKEQVQFKSESSSKLLNQSKILSYSDSFSFVPTFLGDDEFIYGYSMNEQEKKSSLISLNLENNKYSVIKSVNFAETPITFGVYYADE